MAGTNTKPNGISWVLPLLLRQQIGGAAYMVRFSACSTYHLVKKLPFNSASFPCSSETISKRDTFCATCSGRICFLLKQIPVPNALVPIFKREEQAGGAVLHLPSPFVPLHGNSSVWLFALLSSPPQYAIYCLQFLKQLYPPCWPRPT